MAKNKILLSLLAVVAVFALGQAMKADTMDPYFTEKGSDAACPPSVTSWCVSWGTYLDPLIGGKTTLVYYLIPGVFQNLVAGDVEILENGSTSIISDLIRFETLSGAPVAFIYSDNTGGGLPADVGLPSVFQANYVQKSETSTGISQLYTPTAGQPGYTTSQSWTYALQSDEVPEPSLILLLGIALGAVSLIAWRFKA